ncbi:M81 family metallopeptidase [Natrialba sp. SSL1]|uniref:M81 family metallopeptidase n=1 Tax=Natrialba sp. SSL1 TaxID=1869245 RepID=UPI0008F7F5C1|nr:M81 family metallopeptidase [Natrialba sp. SSL1]OIB58937.1 microcystin degradation protein MlrC [Natrialba sp. SSL1]
MGQLTVFAAEFSHETNTFADTPTAREHFKQRREYIGDEVLEELKDTNTTIGGAMSVAASKGANIIPSVAASAMPSGLVKTEAYELYTDLILSDLGEHIDDIDGVFLSLHGAMVQEGGTDGEGPLITAVRDIVSDEVPIVVTLDLHGNITDTMVEEADALIAFESYPHTDMGPTGEQAMDLLLRTIDGEINPVMTIERPPILPFGPKQNTRAGPMAEVMSDARELEQHGDILKVNVFPGFHQADVPSMGFSISVVADGDIDAAQSTAREVAETVWDRRSDFIGQYLEPEAAVAHAKNLVADRVAEDGPIVMADLGDNPGGGGATDGTTVLRQLIEQDATNAGFALIHDPEVVEAAVDAGVGERITVSLGGKTDDRHGKPIDDLELYVKAITNGEFQNTGPMGTGTRNDLGRGVRVQTGTDDEVEVILVENRIQPLDAEIWRHLGIQPERLDILVVKSTNHYRADYEPMASEVIPVNSPGLVAVDPQKFDHQNIERPKFPLDEMDDDAYPSWRDDA